MDVLTNDYPRIKNAVGYEVFLEGGDMLFMPKNCWHYTEYLEPSTSAAYAFYPNKIHHILGFFTGLFYMVFSPQCCGFAKWKSYQKFVKNYAMSEGANRLLMKFIEIALYPIVFPIAAFSFYIRLNFKNQRYNWEFVFCLN